MEKNYKKKSYRLQFIDSARFMAYQVLLIIFLKEFMQLNLNTDTMIKSPKLAELNTEIETAFLNKKKIKDDEIEYKCLCYNKNYKKQFDETLKKRFCITNFLTMISISLFHCCKKMFTLYKYMDNWEKFNKTSLPEKEDFYSHLNMEDITDPDYTHAKKVCKDFEIRNLGKYRGLYIQSNTLLLADVFENFQNICFETYELDPTRFLTTPGSA